jgi:hypothetical protein
MAYLWRDMNAKQLAISVDRLAPSLCRLQFEPLIDPSRQCDFVGCDVLAGIARSNQPAQLFTGIRWRTVKGLCEPPPVHAVAKPMNVLAPSVDAAVAVAPLRAHDLSSL